MLIESIETRREKGFTLIELIVSIIIISILLSIALVVFGNQQRAAAIASLKSDLHASVPSIPKLNQPLTFNTQEKFLANITTSDKNTLGISINQDDPANPVACVWGYHEFSVSDKTFWYYTTETGRFVEGSCPIVNDIPSGTPTPVAPEANKPPALAASNENTVPKTVGNVTFTPDIRYNAFGTGKATLTVKITSTASELTNYTYRANLKEAPFWGAGKDAISYSDAQAKISYTDNYLELTNVDIWNGVSKNRSVTLTYDLTKFDPPDIPQLYKVTVTPDAGNGIWYACVTVKAEGLSATPIRWSTTIDLKTVFKSIKGKTPTFNVLSHTDKGNSVYEISGNGSNSDIVDDTHPTNSAQKICYNPGGSAW